MLFKCYKLEKQKVVNAMLIFSVPVIVTVFKKISYTVKSKNQWSTRVTEYRDFPTLRVYDYFLKWIQQNLFVKNIDTTFVLNQKK